MVRLEQMENGLFVLEVHLEKDGVEIHRTYVFENVTETVDADSLKPLDGGDYYLIK